MWWYNIYTQYRCKFGYHYKNSKISKLGTYHRFSDILKDCSQACRPVPINAWDWSEQDVLTVENVVFNRVEKHFGRMKIHECQLCSCFLFMFFHRFSTQNFNSFYRWPAAEVEYSSPPWSSGCDGVQQQRSCLGGGMSKTSGCFGMTKSERTYIESLEIWHDLNWENMEI